MDSTGLIILALIILLCIIVAVISVAITVTTASAAVAVALIFSLQRAAASGADRKFASAHLYHTVTGFYFF